MSVFRRLFSPTTSRFADAVDESGSSLHAIQRKRAAIGSELRAHAYWYADSKFIVSSIMSVPGSAILEVGEPSVLPHDIADADLGRVVCEHLLAHDAREPTNLRDRKRTEWSAFRASRDKSVAGFESKSVRVMIETINLVVNIEAAPFRSLHPEISVKGTAPPIHADLGATLRRTLNAVTALRDADIN